MEIMTMDPLLIGALVLAGAATVFYAVGFVIGKKRSKE